MNNRAEQTIVACFRDNRGRLIVREAQGREYRDVHPVRMFPVTDPDGPLSICDARCNELLSVESIQAVPPESRPIIQDELNRRMFTPVIRGIARASPVGGNLRLFIVTDRGDTDIVINTEDIYRLSGDRVLIKDLNGIRYLIPDRREMDAQSRQILDMYL